MNDRHRPISHQRDGVSDDERRYRRAQVIKFIGYFLVFFVVLYVLALLLYVTVVPLIAGPG